MINENTSSESLSRELLNRIWAVASVDELEKLLAEDEEAKQNIEQPNLALAAYSHMMQLTFDDPERAKPHILEGLLDWCCKASGETSLLSTMQSYEFRNLIKNWLYQYPFEQHAGIRNALLKKLTESLEQKPSKEKLWTIATIGLRTERIMKVVDGILYSSDESLADTALSVLVGLGVPLSRFDSLLDIVAGKLQANQLTRGCIHAVQELPGPTRTALATEVLRVAETLDEKDTNLSLAFSVASKVAGRSPENNELHEYIWKVFSRHWRTIQMTPSYANSCDVADTLAFHVSRLLEQDDSQDKEIGAYILLTRLAELTKPNQLAAWSGAVPEEFVAKLQRFATLDTKMEGRFVTTTLRLKQEAWETALVAGVQQVDQWIDAAVRDETNAGAVHSVSEIAACIRPGELSDRLLDALRHESDEADLTRHLGMTDLARSCSDRRSFDALLNFGLTKNGNVLLSTVHAITDCALTRIREGDTDVVERVLAQTVPSSLHRHRVAAIDVFCRLAMEGFVSDSDLTRLWDFALDERLDEFSRFRAFEAIGRSDIEINPERRDQLVEIARNRGELGWRSCAVLVKRELAALEDEWLREKLRLSRSDHGVELVHEEEIAGWQAYLVGWMSQRQPALFAPAITQVISRHSDKSLYQLLRSLEHLKRECPENVARALAIRINKSNSSSRTNLELIRMLRLVSPPQLLALAKARDWPNWMPVAKATLCEMVEATGTDCTEHRNDCIALLFDFVRDSSFQVRRSAYRGLANIAPVDLYNLAIRWSRTGDVDLRKRGAESVAWLPRDAYSDVEVLTLGFGWDEEPSVRECFKDVIERRRRLQLSRQYLATLLQGCLKPDGVLQTYRFARALEQIGDDDTAAKIEDFTDSQRRMLPNVGHYLKKTAKAIRKNWKKQTEKWPEPWSHETGIVETVKGQLLVPGKEPIDAVFTLRCRYQKSPSELGEWSATAVSDGMPGMIGFDLPDKPVVMRLENRSDANVYVFGLSWRSNGNTAVFTLGGGLSEFPREVQEAAVSVASIHDQVREAIKHSGVSLIGETKDDLAVRIAVIIEEAELSFLEMGFPAGLKQVCQVASVVLASTARLFNTDAQTSVLLKDIANLILARGSQLLRLTAVESSALEALSRQCDPGSPDELLFWLLERAIPLDEMFTGEQQTQFKPL